jgi:3-methyladenine DNA glycosylase/8-oxoguanine DNA glycosylase
MSFDLRARTPFIFETTIHSHGWIQLAPNVWDAAAQVLTRPERLASGTLVLLRLSAVPNGVHVAYDGRLAAQDLADLRARLTWMFALDADFSAFYALADHEPRLRHCRPQALGRLLRSTTLFEDIVKMMLTTNIQWSGTCRLSRALVERFGAPLETTPAVQAFPLPQTLARLREQTLRNIGLGYRAPYLLALARSVADGSVDLEMLRDPLVPTQMLRKHLIALPGIGPYAAAALLALLGRHNFIPVDTEAVSAVGEFFYDGKKVGEKEINAVFERWGEHRALAYWFWDYSTEFTQL